MTSLRWEIIFNALGKHNVTLGNLSKIENYRELAFHLNMKLAGRNQKIAEKTPKQTERDFLDKTG